MVVETKLPCQVQDLNELYQGEWVNAACTNNDLINLSESAY